MKKFLEEETDPVILGLVKAFYAPDPPVDPAWPQWRKDKHQALCDFAKTLP